jgi:hypothetical protein
MSAARARLFFFLLFFAFATTASSLHAQSVDVYLGVGTATDSASPIPLTQDGVTYFPRESLGGAFGQIGANVMITPNFGVGFEQAFRFSQADYVADLGVRTRISLYDFNFVYEPRKRPVEGGAKLVPVFQSGFGMARVGTYQYQQNCDDFGNCSIGPVHLDQNNRPQIHFSGGVKWNITDHIFLRPQVDAHWIAGFTNVPVYGRNWVPQYTVAIGYTFGRP